ncbi:hypothetical protein SAMN05660284_02791 [Formivibrio citricus]|uniref:Oxaloacetate decarboxylase, gamma chain n=1 Tax=Formivibrio citricus TaxID=83765 RepID=A0A1I5DZB5_9NEIS|nr:hypothetical protein [Formivibrio citricus]SFO04615.1 hypothetical protein SAMN05660284_02791 [Formivibrio citricus]
MNAIIPDSLNGAIILSLIDFFLSFVIIAGIGVVLWFLPILNVIAEKIGAGGHEHAKHKHHGGKKKSHGHDRTQPHVSQQMVGEVSKGHVAAIHGAIYSIVGSNCRIASISRIDNK